MNDVVSAPAPDPVAPAIDPVAAPAAPVEPVEPVAPVAPVDPVKAEPAAPENYEFVSPEGLTLDTEVISAFEGVARDLDLPKDKAQSVIDRVAPVIAARQTAAFEATKTEWGNQAKADKEFGGDAFTENLAVAKLAMDEHFAPDFKAFLESTGLGNHPEMIRGLYRIGKTLSQDGAIRGRQAAGQTDPAKRLFPNQA